MRFNIVKQSDVSFGTALHYALDWSYGRKALCGKEMRSTARDFEVEYKRVCGSCARIMAKNAETAHAQALLTQIELDHVEAIEIAKDRLDIPDFDEEAVYAQAELTVAPGDRGDLINRGRALGFTESMLLSDTDELRRLVKMHEGIEAEKAHAEALVINFLMSDTEDFSVLRIRDSRTGLVRRILGTSLTTNAPHTTIVWVQREGEQGAYAWSADELMSTWHDLVAIDENGQQNVRTEQDRPLADADGLHRAVAAVLAT